MKIFRTFLLAILLLPATVMAKPSVNPRPFTIPAIHDWQGGVGTLSVTAQSRILYADARLQMAAEALARDLQLSSGLSLPVAEGRKAAEGDILFVYKPQKKLGDEGYTIDINKCVRVEAAERGAYHAAQTLLQIVNDCPAGNLPFLPKGRIADRPDYPLRGLVLDCGRKYIPMDYMRRLVRTLRFPLQRTDDALRSRVTNLRVESLQ